MNEIMRIKRNLEMIFEETDKDIENYIERIRKILWLIEKTSKNEKKNGLDVRVFVKSMLLETLIEQINNEEGECFEKIASELEQLKEIYTQE